MASKTVRFSVSENEYNRIKEIAYIKETSMSDLIRTEIFRTPIFNSNILNNIEDHKITLSFNEEELERLDRDRPEDQDRSVYLTQFLQSGLEMFQGGEISLNRMESLKGPGTSASIKQVVPGNLFTRIQIDKPPFVSISRWIAVLILTGAEGAGIFQEV